MISKQTVTECQASKESLHHNTMRHKKKIDINFKERIKCSIKVILYICYSIINLYVYLYYKYT